MRRRRRIGRLVGLGQRLGLALFGAATVGFVVGVVAGVTPKWANFVVACLIAGSLVLAPSIVFSYAVTAADREDAERASTSRRARPPEAEGAPGGDDDEP